MADRLPAFRVPLAVLKKARVDRLRVDPVDRVPLVARLRVAPADLALPLSVAQVGLVPLRLLDRVAPADRLALVPLVRLRLRLVGPVAPARPVLLALRVRPL